MIINTFNDLKHHETLMIFAKGSSGAQGIKWLERHPDCDRWVVNQGWRMPPYREHEDKRWTVVFEVHDYDEMVLQGTIENGVPLYWDRTCSMKECPFPQIVKAVRPEWKKSIAYPWKVINEAFGTNYHTSSISYMIALGIWMGYKTLVLAGVDLGSDWERNDDKPNIMFWLGMAVARGIKILITDETSLFSIGRIGKCYQKYSTPHLDERCITRINGNER